MISFLHHGRVISFLIVLVLFPTWCNSCQSCFWPSALRHPTSTNHHHHHHHVSSKGLLSLSSSIQTSTQQNPRVTAIAVAVARRRNVLSMFRTWMIQTYRERLVVPVKALPLRKSAVPMVLAVGGMVVLQKQRRKTVVLGERAGSLQLHQTKRQKWIFGSVTNSDDNIGASEKDDGEETEAVDSKDASNSSGEDATSSMMIATIGFYKNFISPLLPPACRFVPTCSQYGVQAIKEFGPTKGVILTSWRLLRCSPFGGKGYDPPKWPPVPYTYSSY